MTPNEQTLRHIGLMVKAAWEQRTDAPFPGAVRLRGGKMNKDYTDAEFDNVPVLTEERV